MFKNKDKIRNGLSVGKSENSILRLLRSDMAFQPSTSSLGVTHREDVHDDSQKEIGNAMLMAEQNKAKAMMALQKYRYY